MKKLLALVAATMLSGCSAGTLYMNTDAMKSTDMVFVGVPTVVGIGVQGSAVPVTPTLSLTALHIAEVMPWRIVAVHGLCDVALIRSNNKGKKLMKLETVPEGQSVTTNGYNGFTALPTQGYGVVTGHEYSGRSGFRGCRMGTTNAGGIVGMSGGAVTSLSSGLAGIISEADWNPSRVLYVTAESIAPWLKEHEND